MIKLCHPAFIFITQRPLLYGVYEDLFGFCHAFLNALQISTHYNGSRVTYTPK